MKKKFYWKEYIRSRPDLQKNWNGPIRAMIHYRFFRKTSHKIRTEYFLEPTKKGLSNKSKQKNNVQQREVAIVFFGITRSLSYTLPFIEKNILQVLEKANLSWHIYIHTYDQTTINNPRSGEQNVQIDYKKDIALLPLEACTLSVSSRDDTLKKICLEKYTKHGDPYKISKKEAPFASLKNLLLQLQSLKKAFNLVPQDKQDTAYLFIRPDLAYVDPLPIELIKKCLEKNNERIIYTPEWQKWGGLNDRFAITNGPGAHTYANRFDKAKAFAQKNKLHAEKFLSSCVSQYNRDGLTSRALRVRAHGMVNPLDLDAFYFNQKEGDLL